jgi:hypothetical protein
MAFHNVAERREGRAPNRHVTDGGLQDGTSQKASDDGALVRQIWFKFLASLRRRIRAPLDADGVAAEIECKGIM